MPYRNLAGMRTILTGASSGIGWELARELLRRNAKVILTARRTERLEALRSEFSSSAELVIVPGDITDAGLRAQLIATAQEHWSGLDCLINNAGMGGIGDFSENDEARLRRIMEVNFFAPAELTRAALPLLKQGRQPCIVNVASVLGHVAVPKKSEYCASKFALHGLTDALRIELGRQGIDVLLLCPSTTRTEFFDVALGDRRQIPWAQGPAQTASAVAQAGIKLIQRGTRESILTIGGKALVWLDRLLPSLTSFLIKRFG